MSMIDNLPREIQSLIFGIVCIPIQRYWKKYLFKKHLPKLIATNLINDPINIDPTKKHTAISTEFCVNYFLRTKSFFPKIDDYEFWDNFIRILYFSFLNSNEDGFEFFYPGIAMTNFNMSLNSLYFLIQIVYGSTKKQDWMIDYPF